MRRKKTKKKRKIGNSVLALALLVCPAVFGKDRKAQQPYGMVAVTVFHEPGFALPSAEVTLEPAPAAGEQAPAKLKPLKGITDARGEYVFRVPATAMHYKVHAAAAGYASQEKSVSVEGEQRADVTLILAPESNK